MSLLITASLLTLWTASGVMVSWMEGFRRCYELPKIWGLVKERLISFLLVVFALIPMTFSTLLVAFGSKIETTILFYTAHEFSAYILLMWTCHSLAHRHPYQHRGHRAHLSQRSSAHTALA